MPLADFRRQFHSEIAKKYHFCPDLSGCLYPARRLRQVLWLLLLTATQAQVITGSPILHPGRQWSLRKTTFNKRSFKRGAVQSQTTQLYFQSGQHRADRSRLRTALAQTGYRKYPAQNRDRRCSSGDNGFERPFMRSVKYCQAQTRNHLVIIDRL